MIIKSLAGFTIFAISLLSPATVGAQAAAPAAERAASRFDQWDKNGDGKLLPDELPAALQRNFDRVDGDGDGAISREEDAAIRNRTSDKPRQRGLPDGIKKLDDLDYSGNDNPRQKLDVYLPEGRAAEGAEALPLVVFIHGGGWRSGDKSSGINRLEPLLVTGKYAGASIGYRLSGEAAWPAQIHDCKAAIRLLKAHAEEYGIDPDRIAVYGTSAGGHLVAMLGVTGDVPELEGDIGPHRDFDSEVACVVDFFGPTDLLSMNEIKGVIDHNAPNSPESRMLGGAILERKDVAKQASPISHVSASDAPVLIVHGDEDPVVIFSQSVKFEKALEAAGVPTALVKVEGGGHGKGFGPGVTAIVIDFLAQQLLGAEGNITDQTVPAGE